MNLPRQISFFLLLVAALLAAFLALSPLNLLLGAAENYGEHHEATVPLCWMIASALLSLGLALSAARLCTDVPYTEALTPLRALTVPALFAAGAALVLANEIFFSLYDPKGFPVHPTEQVVFPEAGWHGMTSHLLAALLMTLGFGWMWWALRRRKI